MSVYDHRGNYLQYALELTQEEQQLRQRFSEWLPPTIIDCHSHCNLAEHVTTLDKGVLAHMMSTFPAFTLDDSREVQRALYRGQLVKSIRFPNAYRGVDHRAANDYLLLHRSPHDLVALYGIPDDIHYTVDMLRHNPSIVGLKMYYQYFNPPAKKIIEVFPRSILEAAQDMDIPIILHLPLAITKSVDDFLSILQLFPRLSVVLAHLGLPHHTVPGLMAAYEVVAAYPNVVMDTAMIPSAEVTFMALKAFGASRILFGSDEPLNLIRSRVYHHPTKGERIITEYPYHWVDQQEHQEYKHLAIGAVHTHWQVLSAIQQAVSQLPQATQRSAVEAIFYGNAHRVFGA